MFLKLTKFGGWTRDGVEEGGDWAKICVSCKERGTVGSWKGGRGGSEQMFGGGGGDGTFAYLCLKKYCSTNDEERQVTKPTSPLQSCRLRTEF